MNYGLDISKDIEDKLVSELSKSIDSDILKKLFALGKDRKLKIRSIIEKIKSSE